MADTAVEEPKVGEIAVRVIEGFSVGVDIEFKIATQWRALQNHIKEGKTNG